MAALTQTQQGLILAAVSGLVLTTTPTILGSELCDGRVASLYASPGSMSVTDHPERFEVRRCNQLDALGFIQLVAWPSGESKSPLIVDTEALNINEIVFYDRTLVVEMSHETANTLFILRFEEAGPQLKLRKTYKDAIQITIARKQISIWQGGANGSKLARIWPKD